MPSRAKPGLIWLGRIACTTATAVCIFLGVSSVWLRYALTAAYGLPFWCEVRASAGRLGVLIILPEEDGSRSGFGNPGFSIQRQPSAQVRWWFSRTSSPPPTPTLNIAAPLWFPSLLFGAMGIWCWRMRLPVKYGRCMCGYSLAGLRGGVCPECGRTLVETSASFATTVPKS